MSGLISMESKITLKDVMVIIAFTLFLNSIKTDIAELRLEINGRMSLYKYRLEVLENKAPDAKRETANIPTGVTPRSPNFRDRETEKE